MPKMAIKFMKFYKTLLALKTTICGIFITNVGILMNTLAKL